MKNTDGFFRSEVAKSQVYECHTRPVANYHTAASAAMTALTDSDDDMENAGEFANEEERYQTWSANSMESKLNVLRQALGHYR